MCVFVLNLMIFNSSIRIRINSTINQNEHKKKFSFNFPFLPLNANVIHDNICSIIQQKTAHDYRNDR